MLPVPENVIVDSLSLYVHVMLSPSAPQVPEYTTSAASAITEVLAVATSTAAAGKARQFTLPINAEKRSTFFKIFFIENISFHEKKITVLLVLKRLYHTL